MTASFAGRTESLGRRELRLELENLPLEVGSHRALLVVVEPGCLDAIQAELAHPVGAVVERGRGAQCGASPLEQTVQAPGSADEWQRVRCVERSGALGQTKTFLSLTYG